MPDTSFAALLERVDSATDTNRLQLTPDWMQGRAGYGGLLGALALKAMRSHVPLARKVRSLLISFVGPVGPEAFSIHTHVLRSGKAVTHVEAKLVQKETVRCVVLRDLGKPMPEGQLLKHLGQTRTQ